MFRAKPPPDHTPATTGEHCLLASARSGERLNCLDLPEAERLVRAAFLRALLTGEIAGAPVSDRGLWVAGLIVNDTLDLARLGRAGARVPPAQATAGKAAPGCGPQRQPLAKPGL